MKYTSKDIPAILSNKNITKMDVFRLLTWNTRKSRMRDKTIVDYFEKISSVDGKYTSSIALYCALLRKKYIKLGNPL